MNNALTTSENPITEGQQDLITRLVEDARKKALAVIKPDNPAAQRIITRGDELVSAFIDKMRELSLELPDMPCFGIVDWQNHRSRPEGDLGSDHSRDQHRHRDFISRAHE